MEKKQTSASKEIFTALCTLANIYPTSNLPASAMQRVPASVFDDIWPWRLIASLWTVEISQDVFWIVLVSSLIQYLLD